MKHFALSFAVAIIMSQVLVLARQAITSWSGFHLRPSFREVIEAIENLGKGASKNTDVIVFFSSINLPEFPKNTLSDDMLPAQCKL